jgi:hypothetical protein
MAHEANEGEYMAVIKASALVAIQDGSATTIPDMLAMFNDPRAGGLRPVTEADLAPLLLDLRWEGSIRAEGDAFAPGMETMVALMVEAAKAAGMPTDGEMEVGPQGFRARNDDWAGEVRVIGDGLAVTVEVRRATMRILASHSWRKQAFDIEPTIQWVSVGAVSPEDAGAFAVAVGELSARAEYIAALLAPIASCEDREGLAKRTERWLLDHEAEAGQRLRAALSA